MAPPALLLGLLMGLAASEDSKWCEERDTIVSMLQTKIRQVPQVGPPESLQTLPHWQAPQGHTWREDKAYSNCTHVRNQTSASDYFLCAYIDFVGDADEVRGHYLHLYVPRQSQAPLPTVIWVMGSSFEGKFMAPEEFNEYPCTRYAAAGVACVEVQYRGDPWPAQHQDVRAAIRWVRGQGKLGNYGLGGKIGLMGSSSGSTLASHAWATGHLADEDLDENFTRIGPFTAESPLPDAVVLFGAQYHLEPDDEPGCVIPYGDGVTFHGRPAPRGFSDEIGYAHDNVSISKKMNPLPHLTALSPPVYMAHALEDHWVSPCNTMEAYDAARSKGVWVNVTWLANASHGTESHYDDVRKIVWDFFGKHLGFDGSWDGIAWEPVAVLAEEKAKLETSSPDVKAKDSEEPQGQA